MSSQCLQECAVAVDDLSATDPCAEGGHVQWCLPREVLAPLRMPTESARRKLANVRQATRRNFLPCTFFSQTLGITGCGVSACRHLLKSHPSSQCNLFGKSSQGTSPFRRSTGRLLGKGRPSLVGEGVAGRARNACRKGLIQVLSPLTSGIRVETLWEVLTRAEKSLLPPGSEGSLGREKVPW